MQHTKYKQNVLETSCFSWFQNVFFFLLTFCLVPFILVGLSSEMEGIFLQNNIFIARTLFARLVRDRLIKSRSSGDNHSSRWRQLHVNVPFEASESRESRENGINKISRSRAWRRLFYEFLKVMRWARKCKSPCCVGCEQVNNTTDSN